MAHRSGSIRSGSASSGAHFRFKIEYQSPRRIGKQMVRVASPRTCLGKPELNFGSLHCWVADVQHL
eukprot:2552668-Amphidinium_carterae.1